MEDRVNHAPEPHKDDFVIEVELPEGTKPLLCDRDVHPIRQQIQAIVDGQEAPLEWLTLDNVEEILHTYRELRQNVMAQQQIILGGACPVPRNIQDAIHQCRWELVCLVTQALYGDRKYRAARYWKMPMRLLRRLARVSGLKGRSRMKKHELVYALVASGL
jgi:hypothetical protein